MALIAKIDFICCEEFGSWHLESHNIPKEIALKSDKEIVQYALGHGIIEEYFFVVVYWNDPNIFNEN